MGVCVWAWFKAGICSPLRIPLILHLHTCSVLKMYGHTSIRISEQHILGIYTSSTVKTQLFDTQLDQIKSKLRYFKITILVLKINNIIRLSHDCLAECFYHNVTSNHTFLSFFLKQSRMTTHDLTIKNTTEKVNNYLNACSTISLIIS